VPELPVLAAFAGAEGLEGDEGHCQSLAKALPKPVNDQYLNLYVVVYLTSNQSMWKHWLDEEDKLFYSNGQAVEPGHETDEDGEYFESELEESALNSDIEDGEYWVWNVIWMQ
jgi:hypothetical protein